MRSALNSSGHRRKQTIPMRKSSGGGGDYSGHHCMSGIYNMNLQYGPRREKTCLRRFANNTGADQPAHPRSLISAFVIRVLLSTISKLATSEISFV